MLSQLTYESSALEWSGMANCSCKFYHMHVQNYRALAGSFLYICFFLNQCHPPFPFHNGIQILIQAHFYMSSLFFVSLDLCFHILMCGFIIMLLSCIHVLRLHPLSTEYNCMHVHDCSDQTVTREESIVDGAKKLHF